MENGWNEFDEYTLTLMSNKTHYKKYIKSKIGPNGEVIKGEINDGHSIHYDTTFRKERKYYKKRILALTKDLINKKCDDKEILDPFQEYLKYCIKYLKFKDIADMIQNENNIGVNATDKELSQVDISLSIVIAQSILDKRIENENIDSKHKCEDRDEEDIEEDGDNDYDDDDDDKREKQSHNKIVMRIPDMRRTTMDNYVTTMKNTAPPPNLILPQIKELNIEMMNNAEKKQKKIKKTSHTQIN